LIKIFFSELIHYYDKRTFIKSDGSYDMTTNVDIITNECILRGLRQDNTFQVIEGFALYPRDVFCPCHYKLGLIAKTENTSAIHWFAGSWLDETKQKEIKKLRESIERNKKKRERKIKTRRIIHKIINVFFSENFYQKLKKFLGI